METKEAEVENSNEPSGGNESVEKEDKKEQFTDGASLKSEIVKSAPSIQEPLLKSELKEKDEETIHDSDFEEPSGWKYLHKLVWIVPYNIFN